MEEYIDSIEQAVYLFPFLAALIALPYFFYEYKKYGQIKMRTSLLTFTFLLYIICCYCLIILPIPSYEEVLSMEGPFTDFRIFGFLTDLYENTDFSLNPASWVDTFESVWFYIPFFNLIMLVPFGIFQKRLFENSLIKTFFYALLLSISFEFIQLSGLLGLFPHPYRIFQIDDIILNTLGAIIGWLITPKVKPQKELDVSGTVYSPIMKGRFIMFIIDLILISLILHIDSMIFGFSVIGGSLIEQYLHYLIIGILYYIVLSWFLDQRTPSGYLLDYSYRKKDTRKVSFGAFFFRQFCFFGIILPMPYLALWLLTSSYSKIFTIPLSIIVLLIPIIIVVQISFGLPPVYEVLSGVYLTDNSKLKKITRSR